MNAKERYRLKVMFYRLNRQLARTLRLKHKPRHLLNFLITQEADFKALGAIDGKSTKKP